MHNSVLHNDLFNIGCLSTDVDENGNMRFRYNADAMTYEQWPKLTWDHGRNRGVKIKDVIFNAPATIVFWSDGTKTVVKATNELFDREKGLAMAIAKKFLGNKGNYFNTFKKYIK
jgi:hypothetical protein